MVAEPEVFSLAMTQVTQEELQIGLNNLELKILEYCSKNFGRLQMLKESEDGARHAVEGLRQDNVELRNVFFDHVTSVEEKFTKDLEEARQQLVAMNGGSCGSKVQADYFFACLRGLCVRRSAPHPA